MKFGVLTFGYDTFTPFRNALEKRGFFETNLGDNAQSIAIRHVYRHFGIRDDQMVDINRDALTRYDGEPALLLMNGVFYNSCFPLPPAITPIFVGFHAAEDVIRQQADILRRYQPIGCRDEGTTRHMLALGIEAYTTGCLTFALPPRRQAPKEPKLLIVYGDIAGRLPLAVFRHIPEGLLVRAQLIYHRFHASRFPLDEEMRREAEAYEAALFDRYRREATLVLTPPHHVAAPCMAFGIPTIVCRERDDIRFSFLKTLLPVYTPGTFDTIDWDPPAVDVGAVRASLLRVVGERLVAALRAA